MSRKLDLIDIIAIIKRRNDGERPTFLAREFNVSIARISQIYSERKHHIIRWNKFLNKSDDYRGLFDENDVDDSDGN
jgi:hypothetical protein